MICPGVTGNARPGPFGCRSWCFCKRKFLASINQTNNRPDNHRHIHFLEHSPLTGSKGVTPASVRPFLMATPSPGPLHPPLSTCSSPPLPPTRRTELALNYPPLWCNVSLDFQSRRGIRPDFISSVTMWSLDNGHMFLLK